MASEYEISITRILNEAKRGDEDSKELLLERLWELYFDELVKIARKQIGDFPRRVKDESDILISVFDVLDKKAKAGLLEGYFNRDCLFALLVTIARSKVLDYKKHETAKRRDVGRTSYELTEEVVKQEPSAASLAEMKDTLESLLLGLGDEELRRIAVLKLEGYSSGEIAAALDLSTRSIERKLELIRVQWSEHLNSTT